MRVTLKDIAEEAGVSQMTVSRILNGKADGQVSDAVRQRIAEVTERRGYNPGRNRRACVQSGPSCKKITFLIPYPDFLETPPDSMGGYNPFPVLQEAAREFGGVVEPLPVSRYNSPFTITWEWLKHLGPGDLVLAGGPWEIVPAIELQRRGCKTAILMEDLFWRGIYAPQLKKMAVFTAKRTEAFARLTKYLLLCGYRKIAMTVHPDFRYEPEYPPVKGYEYALNLNGSSYRHLIPVRDSVEETVSAISKDYKTKPFDALIYQAKIIYDFSRTLNENLHLPENVEIATTIPQILSNFEKKTMGVLPPKDQLHREAVKMLLSDHFSIGEWFYDYNFVNIPADRANFFLSEKGKETHQKFPYENIT